MWTVFPQIPMARTAAFVQETSRAHAGAVPSPRGTSVIATWLVGTSGHHADDEDVQNGNNPGAFRAGVANG
jgi:hypothetical protein